MSCLSVLCIVFLLYKLLKTSFPRTGEVLCRAARSLTGQPVCGWRLDARAAIFNSGSDKLACGYWRVGTAADNGGERNRVRRGKGRIPAGSVLHRLNSLAVSIVILVRRSLPHKLLRFVDSGPG